MNPPQIEDGDDRERDDDEMEEWAEPLWDESSLARPPLSRSEGGRAGAVAARASARTAGITADMCVRGDTGAEGRGWVGSVG